SGSFIGQIPLWNFCAISDGAPFRGGRECGFRAPRSEPTKETGLPASLDPLVDSYRTGARDDYLGRFFHRARAAFWAISRRSSAESRFARALPPVAPQSLKSLA